MQAKQYFLAILTLLAINHTPTIKPVPDSIEKTLRNVLRNCSSFQLAGFLFFTVATINIIPESLTSDVRELKNYKNGVAPATDTESLKGLVYSIRTKQPKQVALKAFVYSLYAAMIRNIISKLSS